jgi:hypothetical protein
MPVAHALTQELLTYSSLGYVTHAAVNAQVFASESEQ